MIRRPMLAPREVPGVYPSYFEELNYPLIVSPKLDGIRCIAGEGAAYSRTMKPLPSKQVQELFGNLEDLDGELIVGPPTDFGVYNLTQSHVMSRDKPGDIKYYVFDSLDDTTLPFYQRIEALEARVKAIGNPKVRMVGHLPVENYDELVEAERKLLNLGFEGLILNNPISAYKQGRATFKQGIIYKLKRFTDTEAMIIGFKEGMTNNNAQEVDERGYAKRSSSKENKEGAATLGVFVVDWNGMELSVGPGVFKHKERDFIWQNQSYYLGMVLKFKYFAHGIKDKPRYANALGFRTESDI